MKMIYVECNAEEMRANDIPERSTGHWIDKTSRSGCGVVFIRYVCSACNNVAGDLSDYCPNCGAKMKSEVI